MTIRPTAPSALARFRAAAPVHQRLTSGAPRALTCALLLTLAAASAPLAQSSVSESPGVEGHVGTEAYAGALDSEGLTFVENRGQWPDDVHFLARLGGADVWITDDALVYDFYRLERAERYDSAVLAGPERAGPEADGRRGHIVAMRFDGADARRATGLGRRATYHNYFIGDDPARWASRVPLYDEVVLEGLYEGVDVRLYDDGGLLRYDLVLAPGADLAEVRVRLDGADGVALTAEGALRMETAVGPVEQRGLVAYQEGPSGAREVVESAFVLGADGAFGFETAGADPARPLVVDPLIWASFLGGTGDDRAQAISVGADGSVTVAGFTQDASFPSTPGAYDQTHNGSNDAFVARLSADGSALEYSTFIGGTDWESAVAVAVGPDGSVTVAGRTEGGGFPSTPGAYDETHNGDSDAFVARLSHDGSVLEYSTFVGGNGSDYSTTVALGADGTTTLAGYTLDENDTFPTTPGAYDETTNGTGTYDAFVTRLSADGSSLLYSTLLGGGDNETLLKVVQDVDGSATVVGRTDSENFPTTSGAYDETHNGDFDVFVARLSADGSALMYSTFLGGTNYDLAYSMALDADGSATVAGYTNSSDFPTTPGAYDETHNGSNDAFVARLSADGSALMYSTFLGGTNGEVAYGVALGPDGSATVVGYTNSSDFPTTPGAYDETHNGSRDAFVARLSHDGSALGYGTFLGGGNLDYASAVAVGADGSATVAGYTNGSDFPTTPGAYDETHNGNYDAFVARFDSGLSETSTDTDGHLGAFAVGAVYPNPSSGGASLLLTLPAPEAVRAEVFDVLGRRVALLYEGELPSGTAHRLAVPTGALAPGAYVVRVAAGERVEARLFTVVR